MSPEEIKPEDVPRPSPARSADGVTGGEAAEPAGRAEAARRAEAAGRAEATAGAEAAKRGDDARGAEAGGAEGAEGTEADGGGGAEAPIWAETFRVRSYETDPSGKASMISICNYLQEAASNHARALGVSVEQLKESNTTWVLARLKVEVDRYPRWRNEVQVETWPSGTERLFATRDFLMSDRSGRILGRATSAWLLIDRQRRRPVRLPADIVGLNLPDRPRVFDNDDVAIPLAEFPGSGGDVDVRVIRARYGDMDVNGHVNNVRYIEWAMEPVWKDVLETGQIERLDVQFKGEAVFGDAVEIAVEAAAGTHQDRPGGEKRDSFGPDSFGPHAIGPDSVGPDSLVLLHTVRLCDDARELTRLRSVWRSVGLRSRFLMP